MVTSPVRVVDPLERTCEILFGVIMVLTFTGSISVAEGGRAETKTVLMAAIGCNLAWGIVDAAMFLMSRLAERARAIATLRAVRTTEDATAAHQLIADALPPVISEVLSPAEVESLRERLRRLPELGGHAGLNRADFAGAAGVFLLVFLSTLPVVAPFVLVTEIGVALRASNAIAVTMLFLAGWSLGVHTGRKGWPTGVGLVALGLVLVAVTMALGG